MNLYILIKKEWFAFYLDFIINIIYNTSLRVCDTYHKRNLFYVGFFPQFLIIKINNGVQMFVIIFFLRLATIIFLKN